MFVISLYLCPWTRHAVRQTTGHVNEGLRKCGEIIRSYKILIRSNKINKYNFVMSQLILSGSFQNPAWTVVRIFCQKALGPQVFLSISHNDDSNILVKQLCKSQIVSSRYFKDVNSKIPYVLLFGNFLKYIAASEFLSSSHGQDSNFCIPSWSSKNILEYQVLQFVHRIK